MTLLVLVLSGLGTLAVKVSLKGARAYRLVHQLTPVPAAAAMSVSSQGGTC